MQTLEVPQKQINHPPNHTSASVQTETLKTEQHPDILETNPIETNEDLSTIEEEPIEAYRSYDPERSTAESSAEQTEPTHGAMSRASQSISTGDAASHPLPSHRGLTITSILRQRSHG